MLAAKVMKGPASQSLPNFEMAFFENLTLKFNFTEGANINERPKSFFYFDSVSGSCKSSFYSVVVEMRESQVFIVMKVPD